MVCSNAGSYSDEVAEFAIGLMLAAGKSIVKFDRAAEGGRLRAPEARRPRAAGGLLQGKDAGNRRIWRDRQVDGQAGEAFRDEGSRVREAPGQRQRGQVAQREGRADEAAPRIGRGGACGAPHESHQGLIGREELAAMRPGAMHRERRPGGGSPEGGDLRPPRRGIQGSSTRPTSGGRTRRAWSRSLPTCRSWSSRTSSGPRTASGPSAIITGTVGKGVVENLTRYFRGRR